jgi:hypothetical protein
VGIHAHAVQGQKLRGTVFDVAGKQLCLAQAGRFRPPFPSRGQTADLRRTERHAAADRQVLDWDGNQQAAVDLGAQRQQGRVHVSQQGGLQDRNRIDLDELGQRQAAPSVIDACYGCDMESARQRYVRSPSTRGTASKPPTWPSSNRTARLRRPDFSCSIRLPGISPVSCSVISDRSRAAAAVARRVLLKSRSCWVSAAGDRDPWSTMATE